MEMVKTRTEPIRLKQLHYGTEKAEILHWDGRLDNRDDLRLRLRESLREPITDAALTLAAYERSGTEGLVHLIGDWSAVIRDRMSGTVILASDFAGARPLYYHVRGGNVLWSNRLQSLVDRTGISGLDDQYVAGFLTLGGCPNRTPYKGIYSVPAGHAVCVSTGGTAIRRFWTLPAGDVIRYHSEHRYEEQLRAVFREAVAVESYCGIDGVHFSTHTTPVVTATEAGDAVPEEFVPLRNALARVANNVDAKVVLTGRNGDLLMGNWLDDSLQVAAHLRRLRLGRACREALAWSKVLGLPVYSTLWRALRAALPPSLSPAAIYAKPDGSYAPSSVETSLSARLWSRAGCSEPGELLSNVWMSAPPEKRKHLRALSMVLELRSLQAPEPLQHLDYTHPFAHRPLVEFLMSVPADVLCGPGEPRKLMRRALAGLWPAKLRKRRSKGLFGAPWHEALVPVARDLLRSRQLQVVERGFINRATARASGAAYRGFGLQPGPIAKNRVAGTLAPQSLAGGQSESPGSVVIATFSTKKRKEVNRMQKSYEAPELTLIGRADEVVWGLFPGGSDGDGTNATWDFEFEPD
jgi:hypothetical protein